MADNDVIGGGEFRGSEEVRPARVRLIGSGEEKELRCSVVAGRALFEGDILIGRGLEALGVGVADPRYLWPGKVVAYEIDPALPDPERVEEAIAHWREKTVLEFKPRTREKDYVIFIPESGCASAVGRIGGVQFIHLGSGCRAGNAIHEIGHTVGLWHEHSREDRDDHVKIHWDNIDPRARHNFDQQISDGDDIGPYDYESIMHYPADAFALDPSRPTIEAPPGVTLGQRRALSAGDIAAVARLYA